MKTLNTDAAIEINGEHLYSVPFFAELTRRDVQTIYSFIKTGNSIRKLRSRTYGGKPFVLASEYAEYPFTGRGPNSKRRVSHFNEDTGEEILCPACSAIGGDSHA